MIIYAVKNLITDGPKGRPSPANFAGIPNLFGVCVYSFMCHHSLPALVTPISDKSKLFQFFALDYTLIAVFYLLLAFTGIFAFEHLDDLYTLDFQPKACGPTKHGMFVLMIQYFLALFPVFTLSTNFPIIAITLRNNLKSLFLTEGRHYRWCIRRLVFPILAVVPPVLVAFITKNLEFLVGITGSYAGAGIQYVIPAALVYCARKHTLQVIGMGVKNNFTSPFYRKGWLYFVLVWALASVILVSVDHLENL